MRETGGQRFENVQLSIELWKGCGVVVNGGRLVEKTEGWAPEETPPREGLRKAVN